MVDDGRFFEAVVSPNAQTTNPTQPSRANFTLTLAANEAGGTSTSVPVHKPTRMAMAVSYWSMMRPINFR